MTALLPEFRLFRPVAVDAHALYERIEELTDEQVETFRGLYAGNRRVYVAGVAGSGKTRLALDRALSLARDGTRTLLVCYNRHLAEYLDELVRSSPFDRDCLALLKIRHFHGLARELIQDAQVAWTPPEAGSGAEDTFFADEVPDLMEQAALVLIDESRPVDFEAIVMDEAQDFHSRWWEALNYTLLKDADNGIFYAFADQDQRLWDWAPAEPPIRLSTRFELRRNCRNSRWIARTSSGIAGLQTQLSKRLPAGGKPNISVVPSSPSMKGAVLAATAELLQTQALLPKQIVLIGTRNRTHGALANQADIAGIPLTESVAAWRANKGILVTTARSFKGMEADAVIVYDLDHLSSFYTLTDLYVACTRARAYLHFLVTGRDLVQNIRAAIEHATQECTA
jgi:superfamily I DNA and RNA helicase